MKSRRRDFAITFAAILPIVGLAVAGIWILVDSARSEGLWNTLFLQTEKSRGAYLQSMAVLWGGLFVYLLVIGFLALSLKKRDARAPESNSADDESPPAVDRVRPKWRARLDGVFEGLIPFVVGGVGLVIESGKPEEERVWWVLGLFGLMLLSGGFVIFERVALRSGERR